MPLISVCLITRDEESMLPDCLLSVQGLADEIIVVDTGSTDGTREIARRAGARVTELPWRDDFSAARNASLAEASGDWILVLDADERLAPPAGAVIRAALAGAVFDCGMLPLHNASRLDATPDEVTSGAARRGEPSFLPRLLRRTADLRFEGIIHESILAWLRARGTRLAFLDAPIVHLGSVGEVREGRAKAQRNISLLEKASAVQHDDPTLLGYLAHEYLEAGRREDALAAVDRGWAMLDRLPPGHQLSVLRLATARARIFLEASDAGAVLATVDRAQQLEGKHPDLDFLRGAAHELLALAAAQPSARGRHLEAALAAYRAAIAQRGCRYAQAFVTGAATWAGETRAGLALLLLGRIDEARAAFAAALAAAPGHVEAALGLVECDLAAGQPEAALAAVEPLLGDRADGWLLAAAAFGALGMMGDLRVFLLRARERAARGYLSPHRRALHISLHVALAADLGAPLAGPGPALALGALGASPERAPLP